MRKLLRWNVFVSKSKKHTYAGQSYNGKIDVNMTHHRKDRLVEDVSHTFEHELLHHLIDWGSHPLDLSVRKHHYIIRKMMEDWH